MAILLQAPYSQFLDDDGNPLTGGKVYSYEAGTTTPKATYTDYTGLIAATNPVILDAAGRATIWVEGDYKFTVTDSADVVIRTVDHIEVVDQGGDMTKAVYDPASIAQQVVGTTAVQTITNKSMTMAAGTTSLAPITLTSGTNLTTATAGSFEYGGKVIYATPQSTQRGVVPAEQWYRLDAGLAGANGTSAQNALGVSFGVSASTVYEFEAVINLSKSAGTTSHSLSWLFGGTASLNNISYQVTGDSSTISFTSGFGTRFSSAPQVATAVALYSGLTSAALFVVLNIKGTVSVNAAGTLTPQYILSAAPGGAYTTAQGSYFKIKPIGASGANVSVGNIS